MKRLIFGVIHDKIWTVSDFIIVDRLRSSPQSKPLGHVRVLRQQSAGKNCDIPVHFRRLPRRLKERVSLALSVNAGLKQPDGEVATKDAWIYRAHLITDST